jgi:mycothiol system anti-sigma-R factor
MDCDGAIHRVYHYLDGEMTVWKRRAIKRHLDDCPPCAQGFDFEIELRQVISSKCRDDVPPDLKRRIAEALGVQSASDAGPPTGAGPSAGSG